MLILGLQGLKGCQNTIKLTWMADKIIQVLKKELQIFGTIQSQHKEYIKTLSAFKCLKPML